MNLNRILIIILLFYLNLYSRSIIISCDNYKNTYATSFDTAFKNEIIKKDSLELVLRKDLSNILKEKKIQSIFKNSSNEKINSLFRDAKYLLKYTNDNNYLLCKIFNLDDGTLVFSKNINYINSNINKIVKIVIHDFTLQEIYGFKINDTIELLNHKVILMDRVGSVKELNWIPEFLLNKFIEKPDKIWLEIKIRNGIINPYSIRLIPQNIVKQNPEKIIQFFNLNNLQYKNKKHYYIYIRSIKF